MSACSPTVSRRWPGTAPCCAKPGAVQNAADANRKPIEEHEFLPAALEIMEKPASPGLRMLMLLLCALFAIALLWSVFGRVDVVAVASGRTMPAANVKLIQSIGDRRRPRASTSATASTCGAASC